MNSGIVLQANNPQNPLGVFKIKNDEEKVKKTHTSTSDSNLQPVRSVPFMSSQPRNPVTDEIKNAAPSQSKDDDRHQNIVVNAENVDNEPILLPNSNIKNSEDRIKIDETKKNDGKQKSDNRPNDFENLNQELINAAQNNVRYGTKENEVKVQTTPIDTGKDLFDADFESIVQHSTPTPPENADDYHDVPFGARLTNMKNGDTMPQKPVLKMPTNPNYFLRKPQFPFMKDKTFDLALQIPETLSPVFLNNNQSNRNVEDTVSGHKHETYQLSDQYKKFYFDASKLLFSKPKENNSLNVPKQPVKEFDGQSSMSLDNYRGRKNILPSNSGIPKLENIPSTHIVPENINLPHISENPPTHDNGTDYSILNHVMSLIGSQPNSNFRLHSSSNK